MEPLTWSRVRYQLDKRAASSARHLRRTRASRILRRDIPDGAQLHLGCGTVYLDGWVNIDVGRDSVADVRLDLRGGLPAPSGSVARIYHEHFLEHFSLDDGQVLLNDSFVALRPGGVLRIAMPDLSSLVTAYLGDWRDQSWVSGPEYAFIQTRAEMLNVSMRDWDHRHVYDAEDLIFRLRRAGFTNIRAAERGASDFAELRGLETRADSLLIMEALR